MPAVVATVLSENDVRLNWSFEDVRYPTGQVVPFAVEVVRDGTMTRQVEPGCNNLLVDGLQSDGEHTFAVRVTSPEQDGQSVTTRPLAVRLFERG